MARNEVPLEYTPGVIPSLDPDESAEKYLVRFLPFLMEELSKIRDQFTQLPIIPVTLDPPRAPFDGMVRYFPSEGWLPKTADGGTVNGPTGPYIYLRGNWYRLDMVSTTYYHS
jgi:hypothetical protein